MHRITNLLLVLLVMLLLVCGLQPKPREPKPFNTDKALALFEERLKGMDCSKEQELMLRDLQAIRWKDPFFWESYSEQEKYQPRRDSLRRRYMSVLQAFDFDSIRHTDTVEAFQLTIRRSFEDEDIFITLEKRDSTVWLTSQILGIQITGSVPFNVDQYRFTRKLHKKKQLGLKHWDEFMQLAIENEYWDLHQNNFDSGFDGSNWTLESVKSPRDPYERNRNRKTLHRWAPKSYSAMWKLGQHLLALSGEDFGPIY